MHEKQPERRRSGMVLAVLAVLGSALGAAVLGAQTPPPPPTAPGRSAPAGPPQRERHRLEMGQRMYRVYCASCHGESGQGDGPVAADLKVPPADLSHLAAAAGGVFPYDRVFHAIDGRGPAVRGHGPGTMPVWGWSFQVREKDLDQEDAVGERIRDVIAYLQSIQRK
ncbi:MAG TPA: cytochrome c [Thermoanaerobaculia bacterium]|nr:cytochrome c [Thermoanaerobaculia bacterium]